MLLALPPIHMRDDGAAPDANGRMHPGTLAQELPATSGHKSGFRPRASLSLTLCNPLAGDTVSVPRLLCGCG